MKKKIIFITVLSAWMAIITNSQAQECNPACPDTFRVHHVAGTISPETVTINYPLVETNLSGTNRCWLGRNLGATVDAASANDGRAAAAGWYWQFNRKQGYAHDGTNRTPNTAWITSINENTDWEPANDPCILLLGAGWRLPTSTEWTSAVANGSWGNLTDVYNSVLKLHAAGRIGAEALGFRGTHGWYWSSSQNSSAFGHYLFFDISSANVVVATKQTGLPVRCLRNL